MGLQATMLNGLGMDHTRLTCHYMGRDFRLTNVGRVVGSARAIPLNSSPAWVTKNLRAKLV